MYDKFRLGPRRSSRKREKSTSCLVAINNKYNNCKLKKQTTTIDNGNYNSIHTITRTKRRRDTKHPQGSSQQTDRVKLSSSTWPQHVIQTPFRIVHKLCSVEAKDKSILLTPCSSSTRFKPEMIFQPNHNHEAYETSSSSNINHKHPRTGLCTGTYSTRSPDAIFCDTDKNLSTTEISRSKKTLTMNNYFAIVLVLLISLLNGPISNRIHFNRVEASLIIGDSAIEIQEVDSEARQRSPDLNSQVVDIGGNNNGDGSGGNNLVLGKASGDSGAGQLSNSILSQADSLLSSREQSSNNNNRISGPLPPILSPSSNGESSVNEAPESTMLKNDGDSGSSSPLAATGSREKNAEDDRAISGRVVDFELTPAGGHNKAKIKKKKKKKEKEKMSGKEEKKFQKWSKKKKAEKKFKEMKHMEEMKKKKQEGKKGKKKWGKEVHGQKKKGSFKKKKWGKKVKKGKGVKKGKKGKKMLADKGHKNTGFKTVYHKEEWGGSKKWHDIKREKKWDEQSKKWKKKWKKEKGKKYKGDHMKKYEKQKKHGKKYKKEKKEKFKKEKKEEFKKGMKKKKEEHMKKKEGGKKKEMKEEKKKKQMKKKKKKKGKK